MNYDDVIRKARDMRALFMQEHYGAKIPWAVNVQKFGRVVSEKTGWQVVSRVLPIPDSLRGALIRMPDHQALILINDKNNECWKRFTFLKEVSHLFLEDEGQFITDTEQLASSLVDMEMDSDGYSLREAAGILAAIEIGIPEAIKSAIFHAINVDGLTPYQIAYRLKMPQKYVEYRLRQWGIMPDSGE